jgi:plasmid stabilization system protein ParE
MKYKVSLTVRAEQDRDRAFDWYTANYSNSFAARWLDGVTRAMYSLARDQYRCSKAAETSRFPFELYELLYGRRRGKHRILFRVEQDVVLVLHIRHSARRDLTEDDL